MTDARDVEREALEHLWWATCYVDVEQRETAYGKIDATLSYYLPEKQKESIRQLLATPPASQPSPDA